MNENWLKYFFYHRRAKRAQLTHVKTYSFKHHSKLNSMSRSNHTEFPREFSWKFPTLVALIDMEFSTFTIFSKTTKFSVWIYAIFLHTVHKAGDNSASGPGRVFHCSVHFRFFPRFACLQTVRHCRQFPVQEKPFFAWTQAQNYCLTL